jgi:hypothetical protein
MYEQYNGYVDVRADKPEDAGEAAVRKLCAGAFRGRDRSMWRVERVEIR